MLAGDPAWHAPIPWRSGFRNILAGRRRRGALDVEQAHAIQREAESLRDGEEHEPDSRRVLELVRGSDCSACDCGFVALAETPGARRVTMDGKPLKAFPGIARPLATP